MNKYLKNLLHSLKIIKITCICCGLLFLLIFLFMFFSSIKFLHNLSFFFLFLSFIFSTFAVVINIYANTVLSNKGWFNIYETQTKLFYFLIIIIIINLIYLLFELYVHYIFSYEIIPILLSFEIIIIGLIGFSSFIVFNVRKDQKEYNTKVFLEWSENGIKYIEKRLIEENEIYKKKGEKKVNIFIKYNEIFQLKQNIFLKFAIFKEINQKNNLFQPNSLNSLSVSIGPITKNNKEKIEQLRNIINELDEKKYALH